MFKNTIPSAEITPEAVYLKRRDFMKGSLLGLSALGVGAGSLLATSPALANQPLSPLQYQKVKALAQSGFYTDEALTPYDDVKRYNNFYEFGMDKTDPAKYAEAMTVDPWSIAIEGEVAKPASYQLEDILSWVDLEERIYRLRCVEAWSMVIPWVGFPLAELIKKVQPTAKAKYIQFETLARRSEMRGMRSLTSIIDWPYREGLRMDEAMNPLAFLATGLYGRELPKQNGAPIRLVLPWKYGFKSIKSIVKIRFLEKQPYTTWQDLAPEEYGFYANVNPEVDHPRWSQKFERRLPSSFFAPNRIPTEMFNGYGEQVAHLYKNMNLKKYY
ncbi:protein-methionine-sulfoxide reductase catalytic subunit MsrP [Dasania sp. GY-MA-18]|uniref:Protein-methionine-sulfoxide reductase catalytic subunit MsrP n=1 Tax=Dasania phycosphaerae TaxID=2950436 RepID=A0A9J6RPG2_9GAMM|nr:MULTISPECIES: protein-methionine-sulfoxide reductase catalytic subunit MsrP [Dasania]MCR8923573.1 protein-methionine-sulfoxide reductase catalytic subunit MsrP [Dasania sp. GY-MA-18]MCZ0866007.1 protein-methionine-sulfoxide reductase catalytic subunit MsrP [Dasania phycosphaerae]MCZ0869731.1 protein-methionine-sulfoxide reductase catalytic subunit MsrP [Dasania phycosphaerae]